MAAKIGILGESTVVTVNTTTTLYTVPADKAARIKIIFAIEAGSAAFEMSVMIGSPGIEQTIHRSTATTNDDIWTGIQEDTTPDPTGSYQDRKNGVMLFDGGIELDVKTSAKDYVIAPLVFTYYLSTGDTVKIDIRTTAPLDLLAQVIGVEDDA